MDVVPVAVKLSHDPSYRYFLCEVMDGSAASIPWYVDEAGVPVRSTQHNHLTAVFMSSVLFCLVHRYSGSMRKRRYSLHSVRVFALSVLAAQKEWPSVMISSVPSVSWAGLFAHNALADTRRWEASGVNQAQILC